MAEEMKIVHLAYLWQTISTANYDVHKARRFIYQIPVAVIRVGEPRKGTSENFVCEKKDMDVYNAVSSLLATYKQSNRKLNLKDWLAGVLATASGEAERERLKYVASKVFNTSRCETSRLLGISLGRGNQCSVRMRQAMEYVQVITEMNLDIMRQELKDKLGERTNLTEEENEQFLEEGFGDDRESCDDEQTEEEGDAEDKLMEDEVDLEEMGRDDDIR